MKKLLTIIIPAYNAEKTIARAISSVADNLQNYEIIVAENGSSDATTSIVEKMSLENQDIILIHTDKGVSKARNAALKRASGDWIVFLDADDVWLASHAIVQNMICRYSEADIIICSYMKDDRVIEHDFNRSGAILKDQYLKECIKWLLRKPTRRMSVWAKLFKRTHIQANMLLFNETLRVSEDSEFLLRSVLCCNAAVIVKTPVYKYCSDYPSVMRSIDTTRKWGYIKALKAVSEDMRDADCSYNRAYAEFVAAHLNLICVHDIFNCNIRCNWSDRIREVQGILDETVINQEVGKIGIKMLNNVNNVPPYLFKKGFLNIGGALCFGRSVLNNKRQKNNSAEMR